MCAVRNHAFSSLLVFTSRTRSAPRLLGVPEYAMVVFAAPQLRENEELRNDPSSFEGRARTDKAAVKTRHPGDCVATRAGGSKEWDWTRSAPAPPSSSFRGCAASWIVCRHLRIVSSQGLGRGAQSRRVVVVGAREPRRPACCTAKDTSRPAPGTRGGGPRSPHGRAVPSPSAAPGF